jgi:hypothetical protein
VSRYPLDLRGVAEKLDRAADHISVLNNEIEEFRNAHPVTTFAEFDGGHDYVVKVRVPQTPDVRWGVILGDVIHNLRSALDHAVWELVQRNVRAGFRKTLSEAQESAIQYPICDTRKQFSDARVMPFLTTRQIAFSRKYQPYLGKWPEATPLSQLAWLSNTDKHRIVHGSHTALETWESGYRLQVRSNDDAGHLMASKAVVAVGDRLQDGDAVVRLTFDVRGPNPEVEAEGEFASDIRFGDGRPIPSAQLAHLHQVVLLRLQTLEAKFG